MPNEAAIDSLMQCLFDFVPEECTAFWARCVMLNDRPKLAIFYDTAETGSDIHALNLSPDAQRQISECFRTYQDALKRTAKPGWQVATIVAEVGSEGEAHFKIDTSYEAIRESELEKFTADWETKYLPGRRIGTVPHPSDGVSALPLELDRLLDESMRWLAARSQELDASGRIREHSRWSFDLALGEIRFDFADGRSATAPFQAIGTINTRTGTWLWAWDNPSITESLRQHALAVRAFGEGQRYDLLTTRTFPCDEELAWRLTALAAKLNHAQGAYRAPAGSALLFVTFGKVTLQTS